MTPDDHQAVRPDGATIRRRRRIRGWSRRDFVDAIAAASVRETGLAETIPPALLQGIEEANEPIPYGTLCRIAAGLDCNPVEILAEESAAAPAARG